MCSLALATVQVRVGYSGWLQGWVFLDAVSEWASRVCGGEGCPPVWPDDSLVARWTGGMRGAKGVNIHTDGGLVSLSTLASA